MIEKTTNQSLEDKMKDVWTQLNDGENPRSYTSLERMLEAVLTRLDNEEIEVRSYSNPARRTLGFLCGDIYYNCGLPVYRTSGVGSIFSSSEQRAAFAELLTKQKRNIDLPVGDLWTEEQRDTFREFMKDTVE